MKVFLVFALALVAVATADRVNVVDNNGVHVVDHYPNHNGVHVVDHYPNHNGVTVVDNPNGVNVVDNNPNGVNVVDNNPNGVHVVDNKPGDEVLIANPDSFFYGGGQGPAGAADISPAYVENRPPYPYQDKDRPYLRSGN